MLSHFDFCFGLKTNVTFVSLSLSFWLVLFDFFYIQPWSCHLILLFLGLCMVIVFLSVFIVVLKSFITFVFVFFYFLCFCPFFFPVTLYLFVGLYWRVLLFSSLICRFLFSSNFFSRIAPVCHCLQNQKGLLMSAVVLFLPRFELCISVWRGFLQWQKGF